MLEGRVEIRDLGAYLTIMGVEEDNLLEVFVFLDPEGTDVVDGLMFATELYKMQPRRYPCLCASALY